jgi:hypothetical protein
MMKLQEVKQVRSRYQEGEGKRMRRVIGNLLESYLSVSSIPFAALIKETIDSVEQEK